MASLQEILTQKAILKCPKDGSALESKVIKGFEIDHCNKCSGLWYNEDEFKSFFRQVGLQHLSELRNIKIEEKQKLGKEINEDKEFHYCPVDHTSLKKVNYGGNSNIWIEKCLYCTGIWMDGGEIYHLLDYLKVTPNTQEFEKRLSMREPESERDRISIALIAPFLFIPYKDKLKTVIFPYLNLFLIAINILVFIAMEISMNQLEDFYQVYGFIPASGFSASRVYTIITHMFIHAGFLHLIGNMIFLFIFGDNIEEKFGRTFYFFAYLFSGLGALSLQYFITPSLNIPMVGASGAISGVLGAYLMFYPKAKIHLVTFNLAVLYVLRKHGYNLIQNLSAKYYIIAWFLFQLVFSLIGSGGIAYFAHIGGFLTGVFLAYIYKNFVIEKEQSRVLNA